MSIEEALEYLTDFSIYSPYQEVIDKVSAYIEQMQSDYENRLKADMVAMLTELKSEIDELTSNYEVPNIYVRIGMKEIENEVQELVQQKINSLKEVKDGLHT